MPCPKKKRNPKRQTLRHTLQSVPPPIVEEWAAVVPLVYRRPTHGKTLGMPSKLNTHQQQQTQKVFTKPPSLSLPALTGFLGGLQEVGKIKDKYHFFSTQILSIFNIFLVLDS